MTASLADPEPGDRDGGAGAAVIAFSTRRRSPKQSGMPRSGQYQVEGALALKRDLTEPSTDVAPPALMSRTAVIVARALLEVLSGRRPVGQLSRWTSFSLQQDLERRAPRRPTRSPLQLLRVRISEQSPGIAEVCALAEDTARRRVRVIALRMEHREGEWVVTRLQAG